MKIYRRPTRTTVTVRNYEASGGISSINVLKNSVLVGSSSQLNFVEGDNVSIDITEGDDQLDISLSSSVEGYLPLAGGTMEGAIIAAAHSENNNNSEVVGIVYSVDDPPDAGSVLEGTLWFRYTP